MEKDFKETNCPYKEVRGFTRIWGGVREAFELSDIFSTVHGNLALKLGITQIPTPGERGWHVKRAGVFSCHILNSKNISDT